MCQQVLFYPSILVLYFWFGAKNTLKSSFSWHIDTVDTENEVGATVDQARLAMENILEYIKRRVN